MTNPIAMPAEPDQDEFWTAEPGRGGYRHWFRHLEAGGWTHDLDSKYGHWPWREVLEKYGPVYLSDPRPADVIPARPWRVDGDGYVWAKEAATGFSTQGRAVSEHIVRAVNAYDDRMEPLAEWEVDLLRAGLAERDAEIARLREELDRISGGWEYRVERRRALTAENERMADALRLIAGDRCENYTSGRCSDESSGRARISTTGTADQWCDACRAADALAGGDNEDSRDVQIRNLREANEAMDATASKWQAAYGRALKRGNHWRDEYSAESNRACQLEIEAVRQRPVIEAARKFKASRHAMFGGNTWWSSETPGGKLFDAVAALDAASGAEGASSAAPEPNIRTKA